MFVIFVIEQRNTKYEYTAGCQIHITHSARAILRGTTVVFLFLDHLILYLENRQATNINRL